MIAFNEAGEIRKLALKDEPADVIEVKDNHLHVKTKHGKFYLHMNAVRKG